MKTDLRCIFIGKLPDKMIFEEGTDTTIDLKGMEVYGVLNDESYKIFLFDNKDIEIIKNVDTSIIGLQTIGIQVENEKLIFSVYVKPKDVIIF